MQQNMFCCSVNCHKTWQNMALITLPYALQYALPFKLWLAPRFWSIVQISGRWPLPLFGTQLFPLTTFGKCGEHDATVEHALCACRCTQECYNVLRTEAAMVPPRWCGQAILDFVFFPMIQCRQNFEICYSLFSQALGHLVTFKNAFDTRAKSKEGTSGRFVSISHIGFQHQNDTFCQHKR
jgi:hypothetical protein